MVRVLIVDDSALSRRIMRKILESAGHQVIEAEDGVAALEQYYLEKPDLVLLDLTMAGMNGWDVLTKLREMDPGVRVIVATADIQKSTQDMAMERGATAFLNKPFEPESVVRMVDAAMGDDV